MTPRARWSLALGGLGLATAIVACLNPQPLPPADARATNAEDSGATFGGADGSVDETDPEATGANDAGTDAHNSGTDAGDAGDAGIDAGDAGDAGDDPTG